MVAAATRYTSGQDAYARTMAAIAAAATPIMELESELPALAAVMGAPPVGYGEETLRYISIYQDSSGTFTYPEPEGAPLG